MLQAPYPRSPRMLLCPHLQGWSEEDRVPETNGWWHPGQSKMCGGATRTGWQKTSWCNTGRPVWALKPPLGESVINESWAGGSWSK